MAPRVTPPGRDAEPFNAPLPETELAVVGVAGDEVDAVELFEREAVADPLPLPASVPVAECDGLAVAGEAGVAAVLLPEVVGAVAVDIVVEGVVAPGAVRDTEPVALPAADSAPCGAPPLDAPSALPAAEPAASVAASSAANEHH